MKTAYLWRMTLAGLALALLGGSLALGQDRTTVKAPTPKAGNGDTGDLRTFQLTYADAEEVKQIVTQLGANLAARPGSKPPTPPFPPVSPTLRLAVDQRTRTLFVRGTEKELDAVADLVGILDSDPAKPAPEGRNARVIRLRYAKVPEVTQVLTGLNLQGQVIALPRTNALLLIGTDSEKEVRTVIEKLDVESKATTKPPVKKPTPPVGN
jgi:type II secretory pathway component GspD/PulD (secretin)